MQNKEHYWKDSRLTVRKKPAKYHCGAATIAILSPEDERKIGTWDRSNGRRIEVQHLNLEGILDDTIHKSTQVKGVCYQCGCTIFYYDGGCNYPKICPLGHPAYEEL